MRAIWILCGCLGLAGCHLIYPFSTGQDPAVDAGVTDVISDVVTDMVTDAGVSLEAGQAPFLPGWTYRKRIKIPAGAASTALKEFPLLVQRIADKDLAKGARGDGLDIAFTAADGTTRLVHELEGFSADTGALTAWVRLPALAASVDTVLYLHYGNASAASQQDVSTLWGPSGYLGVWHLQSLTTISNAAGTSPVGTSVGGVTSAAGKIRAAASFDGQPTSWINLNDGTLAANSPFTVEAWFKQQSVQTSWIGIVTKGRLADLQWVGLWINPSNLLTFGWSWRAGAKGNQDATEKPAVGVWHQVVATFDGAVMRLYLDGKSVAKPRQNTYQAIAQPLIVGCDRRDSNPSIDGLVDEVRLSKSERSAAWIAAQYDNQSAPESFYAVGPQEQAPASP
jgi:hypothetical protein